MSAKNTRMEYRYDLFMPKGIFWQCVVLLYRYIKNHDWVWRNGVILERQGTQAEIIENLSERRIYLKFVGPSIPEFRAIITDTLEDISRTFHNLDFKKMVPCQCKRCIDHDQPHLFEFAILKQRYQKRQKPTIECQLSAEDVPLSLLLEGYEIPVPKDHHPDPASENESQPQPPSNKTKTIKIFLASSSKLEQDRKDFEIFINCKNKVYKKQGVFLELVVWEDFLDAMAPTGLQNKYNQAVAESDIFISLFHTKVGKYTEEEFSTALETFKAQGRPHIYTYFKNQAVNLDEINSEILSLLEFKKKLKALGHYPTTYKDIDDLKYQFGEQLNKLLPQL